MKWHVCMNALLLRSGSRDYFDSNMHSSLVQLPYASIWLRLTFRQVSIVDITTLWRVCYPPHYMSFHGKFSYSFHFLLRGMSTVAHLIGDAACPLIPLSHCHLESRPRIAGPIMSNLSGGWTINLLISKHMDVPQHFLLKHSIWVIGPLLPGNDIQHGLLLIMPMRDAQTNADNKLIKHVTSLDLIGESCLCTANNLRKHWNVISRFLNYCEWVDNGSIWDVQVIKFGIVFAWKQYTQLDKRSDNTVYLRK